MLPVVNAGYLEPLDDVLTDEVKAAYPESFIEMSDGKGVPMFMTFPIRKTAYTIVHQPTHRTLDYCPTLFL